MNTQDFKKVRKLLEIPSITGTEMGISTQFSVGVNYWSGAHQDKDFFFTFLSCLSANSDDHEEEIYYFCYPEYKIALPLKPGDLIVFNPLKFHCCSNSRYDDAYIFSAYVSEKTVMTAGIAKYLV
jgi:hypothetical protein